MLRETTGIPRQTHRLHIQSRGTMLRRSVVVVGMLLPLVMSDCASRESAQRPRDTLVVSAPPPLTTPASAPAAAPDASDSAALGDASLDTARITERFVTPEVVFRYERGGRASELPPFDGAARIVRLDGRSNRLPDGSPGGPAYSLEISWYPLAPAPTLDAWAKVHADPEVDDEAEEKAAAGGPPVPAGMTSPTTVAGRPALAQSLSGIDATLERRYVQAGPWVLVFRWASDEVEGRKLSDFAAGPLALLQRLEWTRDRDRQ